ncbi:hypothetical protein LCGC14_0882630 [marine sediment metagenome]|uniref:Uncharacterized protein n=1 Tax=marine sediment metagenome TaxID=412755 RepID=A0A0F9P1B7_9ZZZZ
MIAILLISGVITPAFIWVLLYSKIHDQYADDEGMIMIETKEEAQKAVRKATLKSPMLYLYLVFSTIMIGSGAIAYDVFGLGWDDWFFAL